MMYVANSARRLLLLNIASNTKKNCIWSNRREQSKLQYKILQNDGYCSVLSWITLISSDYIKSLFGAIPYGIVPNRRFSSSSLMIYLPMMLSANFPYRSLLSYLLWYSSVLIILDSTLIFSSAFFLSSFAYTSFSFVFRGSSSSSCTTIILLRLFYLFFFIPSQPNGLLDLVSSPRISKGTVSFLVLIKFSLSSGLR